MRPVPTLITGDSEITVPIIDPLEPPRDTADAASSIEMDTIAQS